MVVNFFNYLPAMRSLVNYMWSRKKNNKDFKVSLAIFTATSCQ